jgi:hypothetical protein
MESKNKIISSGGSLPHFIDDEEPTTNSGRQKETTGKTSMFTFSNDPKKNDCFICNKYSGHNYSDFHNSPSSIASEIRISNLERRLDNTEKMLKFYEEMFRLKDEEKKNEFRIDLNRLNELGKKVICLEDSIKILAKRINDQTGLFDEKVIMVDKKIGKLVENRNSIGDFYANKLAEVESLIKKNDIFVENLIDEKVANINTTIDGKLEDLLNLINDMGKSTEQNEFNILESKENIRTIQSDHLDFIKILSILKEKCDSLDYVMSQITDLKGKYSKIMKIYGEHSKEEDKFLNKILGGEF